MQCKLAAIKKITWFFHSTWRHVPLGPAHLPDDWQTTVSLLPKKRKNVSHFTLPTAPTTTEVDTRELLLTSGTPQSTENS